VVQSKHASRKPTIEPKILYYQPTIDVAQYALHQGDSRSANLIEGFIPLGRWTFEKILFVDARFYNPNGTPIEWNIDLGFRHVFNQGNQLFGIYAGYDRYRSETRRYYSQVNAGLELWFNRFFIGGNGYLPVGTKAYDNDAVNLAYLVPTNTSYRYNIAFAQGKERAMPGGDAEMGYAITPNLTLYGGGYYFDHADAKSIAGPKFRATYTFYRSQSHRLLKLFDRIRLEGLISHDSVRGTSWMAGLRFRFGLSKHPNPTTGVARHMTDPIRRDLNVVSENFNDPSEFYKIDDRRARVDLVSNSSGRSIDEAVDGSSANADIIGVVGDQTAALSLSLGLRAMTITGGKHAFSVNGHPYTVYNVGQNGSVMAAAGEATFNLVPDAEAVTLEHLGLLADDDQFALTNNNAGTYGSFAHLTIHDVTSNAPILLKLTDDDENATGSLTFTNNTITLTNSSATDSDAGDGEGGIMGLGLLVTGTNDQQLIVSTFNSNQIEMTNTDQGSNLFALDVESHSDNPVRFTHGMKNNTLIIADGNDSDTSKLIAGFYIENMKMTNNFANNQIQMNGYSDQSLQDSMSGIWIGITSDGFEINAGNFQHNNIAVTNLTASGLGINIQNNMLISGNFSGNRLSSTGNGTNGYPIYTTNTPDLEIGGNFSNNTVIASNNVNVGRGYTGDANLTIMGNFDSNTFTAEYNDNGGVGFLYNGSTPMFVGKDFAYNVFTAKYNVTTGCAMSAMGVTVKNDFHDNHFISAYNSSNGFKDGLLIEDGEANFQGNFSNNHFLVHNNGSNGQASGIRIRSMTTFVQNFRANDIQVFQNTTATSNGILLEADSTTFNSDVSQNDIKLYENSGNVRGVYIINSTEFINGIKNNTITVTDEQGLASRNTGFWIDVNSSEVVSFYQAVINNNITVPDDEYAFEFNTNSAAGTINFYGNSSPGELSASNYNASVNPDTAGNGIYYLG
jgi:hypothetical protein